MAQQATMRQVFQCLGFSQQAMTAVVDDQGINLLDELRILKDDEITNLHQGLDSWDQNDSFLNFNDCASKRPFFNIGSKIPHKFDNLVLICESQSNQRRPNLTWDLNFAFIDQMVLVNNWLQVIDLVIHIDEFGVRSLNLMAIKLTGPPIIQLDCNQADWSNYHMIYVVLLNVSK
jgi:hypothetical protein